MFEKEAEEIANKKLCSERICYNHCNFNSPKHHRCGEWHRIYDCAKESAEFGYNKAKVEIEDSYRESLCNSELNLASVTEQLEELNKANEWHYVKDGDIPKDEDYKLCITSNGNYYIARYEELFVHWSNQEYKEVCCPYAWKEITFPNEVKEND